MKHRFIILWVILGLFAVLTACAHQGETPLSEVGYPLPDEATNQQESLYELNSGYPPDIVEQQQTEYFVEEIIIPLPEEGQAVVHGRLLSITDEMPYLAPSLYLGSVLKPDSDSEDAPLLTSISIDDDPVALQAIDGNFVFNHVSPGEYGLFLWTPMSAFIIQDAKTGNAVLIDVKPDEIYDLGTVYVP